MLAGASDVVMILGMTGTILQGAPVWEMDRVHPAGAIFPGSPAWVKFHALAITQAPPALARYRAPPALANYHAPLALAC